MLQFFRLLTDSVGHGPILLFLDCVFVHASVEFRTAAKREFSHTHMISLVVATRTQPPALRRDLGEIVQVTLPRIMHRIHHVLKGMHAGTASTSASRLAR